MAFLCGGGITGDVGTAVTLEDVDVIEAIVGRPVSVKLGTRRLDEVRDAGGLVVDGELSVLPSTAAPDMYLSSKLALALMTPTSPS